MLYCCYFITGCIVLLISELYFYCRNWNIYLSIAETETYVVLYCCYFYNSIAEIVKLLNDYYDL
jgi:hypothetical protein